MEQSEWILTICAGIFIIFLVVIASYRSSEESKLYLFIFGARATLIATGMFIGHTTANGLHSALMASVATYRQIALYRMAQHAVLNTFLGLLVFLIMIGIGFAMRKSIDGTSVKKSRSSSLIAITVVFAIGLVLGYFAPFISPAMD